MGGDHPWLEFVDEGTSPTGKTVIVGVRARYGGDRLGVIRWFNRWRQYAFHPEAGCVFNSECLATIAERCRVLTGGHYAKRKAAA